jgi:hypothetical protein
LGYLNVVPQFVLDAVDRVNIVKLAMNADETEEAAVTDWGKWRSWDVAQALFLG